MPANAPQPQPSKISITRSSDANPLLRRSSTTWTCRLDLLTSDIVHCFDKQSLPSVCQRVVLRMIGSLITAEIYLVSTLTERRYNLCDDSFGRPITNKSVARRTLDARGAAAVQHRHFWRDRRSDTPEIDSRALQSCGRWRIAAGGGHHRFRAPAEER